MHAALGHFLHRQHWVHFLGIHHVRGAKFLRELKLGRHHVDGDDAAGTGNGRAVDGREADAAAADHGHRFARLNLGRVDDRAYPGGHAAADEGGDVEGHIRANLRDGVLVEEHVFGIGREVQELVHGGAGFRVSEARLIVGAAVQLRRFAEGHVPREAVLAVAAKRG